MCLSSHLLNIAVTIPANTDTNNETTYCTDTPPSTVSVGSNSIVSIAYSPAGHSAKNFAAGIDDAASADIINRRWTPA